MNYLSGTVPGSLTRFEVPAFNKNCLTGYASRSNYGPEDAALMDLYASTGGVSGGWMDRTGWPSAASVGNCLAYAAACPAPAVPWKGVSCNGNFVSYVLLTTPACERARNDEWVDAALQSSTARLLRLLHPSHPPELLWD